MSDETKNIKAEKVRWRNRRWMAWASLISMILATFIILFTNWCPESRLIIVTEVITWYYFGCVSVVASYMGVTTFAHIKGKVG